MNIFDKKVNALNNIFGHKYDLPIGTEFTCQAWHLGGNGSDTLSFKVVSQINSNGDLIAECINVNRWPTGPVKDSTWIGKRKRIAAHRVDIFLNGR